MRRTTRERTAYHEAGHAVAAFSYNKRLHRVSTTADHDAGLPRCVKTTRGIGEASTSGDADRYLRLVTETVTILLAGGAAEREHAQAGRGWTGGASDRRAAAVLAGRIVGGEELGPYMKWLVVRTSQLVKSRWPAIEALAQELLVREEMSGAAATAFIRHTLYPTMPADDIARLAAQLALVATR
jgi:hypothetical protein